jgi:hypothetical protein
MEIVTCLLKLGIIINNRSHWILAPEDPCTIHPPCSNDNLDMPDYSARPSVMDRAPLDYIVFANLIQQIQITQFHNAEICWVVTELVAGNLGWYLTALRLFHSGAADIESPTLDCKVATILESSHPGNISIAQRRRRSSVHTSFLEILRQT